jgi:hypothetical protein
MKSIKKVHISGHSTRLDDPCQSTPFDTTG